MCNMWSLFYPIYALLLGCRLSLQLALINDELRGWCLSSLCHFSFFPSNCIAVIKFPAYSFVSIHEVACIFRIVELNRLVISFSSDSKDRKIEELTMELERQDQLCNLYWEQLIRILRNIEEQTEILSTKIQVIANKVKEFETASGKSLNY